MTEFYDKYSQINCDPRIIAEIERDSRMSNEQGPGFMREWGGPDVYQRVAAMPEDMRLTLMGYLKGFANTGEIADATGLDPEIVNRNIRALGRQGLIEDYKEVIL